MSMSVRRALSSDVCVNSGDRQMDPVKGSKRCQKRRRVGGRGPLFLWMVGAVRPGGPGTCIHCAARPQPARRLTVRARLALSPPPPPGPRWPEDQQEGLESVTSISRYRLSVRNHPPPPSLGLLATRCIVVIPPRPSTVHGPRSARRCGCRQGTALQFSRPHPVSKSTRFASDDAPLSPPPLPQAPRQSPVPRTPARHHTQARLASPTTLTPLLFPLGAHPHHSSRFKHCSCRSKKPRRHRDQRRHHTPAPRAARPRQTTTTTPTPRLDVGFSMLPCRVAPAPSERQNITAPSGGKQLGSRATPMQPP